MSGEALTSAHPAASVPATAIEDWVLGAARTVPLRTPEQLRQLQFHCGKPPPAADPSTRILTAHQRLAMYRVISMPKRTSIARGVSQRMTEAPVAVPRHDTEISQPPQRRGP
jgi:hypothetical protein